jgi:hypothetical protein
VNGVVANVGVRHGARLVIFTEAVMGHDEGVLAKERAALRAVLSAEEFVDVAAVIAAFSVVDRIADATGIPLDDMMQGMSADLRARLGWRASPLPPTRPALHHRGTTASAPRRPIEERIMPDIPNVRFINFVDQSVAVHYMQHGAVALELDGPGAPRR